MSGVGDSGVQWFAAKSSHEFAPIMPAATTSRLQLHASSDLTAMLDRANEQIEIVHLSLADQVCIAQALVSPPPRAPALERAIARREKLLGGDTV